MKITSCTRIGRIIKPHGIKGELSIKFEPDWVRHKNFSKQKLLFIGIYPGDDPVPFFIEHAEADMNGLGRIKFEDYSSLDAVRIIAGKEIYVPSEIIGTPKTEKNKKVGFTGYTVYDKIYGKIGMVTDIIENDNQQLLNINRNNNELLIPLVKEFIIKIDKKEKTIHMQVPEGLLDINN